MLVVISTSRNHVTVLANVIIMNEKNDDIHDIQQVLDC